LFLVLNNRGTPKMRVLF